MVTGMFKYFFNIFLTIYIYIYVAFTFLLFFSHRLRQIDLEILKRLHRKVNVVPVIAKADTLTNYEVKKLKERILTDIEEHEIQVLYFSQFFNFFLLDH